MDKNRKSHAEVEATVKAFYEAAEKMVANRRFGWKLGRHITIAGLVQAMATLAAANEKDS